MPVITLFSGSYCNEQQIVQEIASRTGYRLMTDREVVAEDRDPAALGKPATPLADRICIFAKPRDRVSVSTQAGQDHLTVDSFHVSKRHIYLTILPVLEQKTSLQSDPPRESSLLRFSVRSLIEYQSS